MMESYVRGPIDFSLAQEVAGIIIKFWIDNSEWPTVQMVADKVRRPKSTIARVYSILGTSGFFMSKGSKKRVLSLDPILRSQGIPKNATITKDERNACLLSVVSTDFRAYLPTYVNNPDLVATKLSNGVIRHDFTASSVGKDNIGSDSVVIHEVMGVKDCNDEATQHSFNALFAFFSSFSIIKVFMVFIDLLAVTISAYFTYVYASEFYNVFQSLAFSIFVVGSSFVLFQYAIYFFKKKKYFVVVLFAIMWALFCAYSILTTIAGQYNIRMNAIVQTNEINSVAVQKQEEYLIYEASEKNLQQMIDMEIEKRKPLQKILDSFQNADDRNNNSWVFVDTNKKMDDSAKELERLRTRLEEVRTKKISFLQNERGAGNISETTLHVRPFYEWIGSVLGVSADIIMFWINLFPGLIVDLVAPVCGALLFFDDKDGIHFYQKKKDVSVSGEST